MRTLIAVFALFLASQEVAQADYNTSCGGRSNAITCAKAYRDNEYWSLYIRNICKDKYILVELWCNQHHTPITACLLPHRDRKAGPYNTEIACRHKPSLFQPGCNAQRVVDCQTKTPWALRDKNEDKGETADDWFEKNNM